MGRFATNPDRGKPTADGSCGTRLVTAQRQARHSPLRVILVIGTLAPALDWVVARPC